MLILGIDTSGKTASVAVCDENFVIAQTTILTNLTHSQVILPLLERLLSDSGISLKDIDVIAVANGPGSYTGLRIGISAVKGMAFALDKSCVGISTLESLAFNVVSAKANIVSLMKARPDIAYCGIFKSNGEKLERIYADKVISLDEVSTLVNSLNGDVIILGDYSFECYNRLFSGNTNVRLAPVAERLQLASSLCMLAINNPNAFESAEKLNASYLQVTKAEKDIGIS